MSKSRFLLRGAAAAALVLIIAFGASSVAADIIDDWAAAKLPPVPELKAVTLEGASTALLIMDMMKTSCSKPRCIATLPNVVRLNNAARAGGAMIWVALTGDQSTGKDVADPGFVPKDGEWEVMPGPDKFLNSTLDAKLKARGIKTVIVCGMSFQGVGVGTSSAAAGRGYKVIVPVDCLSSDDLYQEQYSAWHLSKGGPGSLVRAVTLTRSTMIKFQ